MGRCGNWSENTSGAPPEPQSVTSRNISNSSWTFPPSTRYKLSISRFPVWFQKFHSTEPSINRFAHRCPGITIILATLFSSKPCCNLGQLQCLSKVLGHLTISPTDGLCLHLPLTFPNNTMLSFIHPTLRHNFNIVMAGGGGDWIMTRHFKKLCNLDEHCSENVLENSPRRHSMLDLPSQFEGHALQHEHWVGIGTNFPTVLTQIVDVESCWRCKH